MAKDTVYFLEQKEVREDTFLDQWYLNFSSINGISLPLTLKYSPNIHNR